MSSPLQVCQTGIVANLTVAATGTLIAPATTFAQVGTCTAANNSVLLSKAVTGQALTIRNDGAAACQVFPPTTSVASGFIDALSAGVAAVIQPGGIMNLVCKDGWAWNSVGVIPAYSSSTGLPTGSTLSIALTGTTTLTATSPQNIIVGQLTGNSVIALPAAAAGLQYDIRVHGTGTETKTLTVTATAAVIQGSGIVASGTAASNACVPIAARTNIILTAALIGDSILLKCMDGTNWMAQVVTSAVTLSVS